MTYYEPPSPGTLFPVMVFFYGGCWKTGSASWFAYKGNFEEGYAEDTIVVTVNYRLGAFGFLGSKEPKDKENLALSSSIDSAIAWYRSNKL